MTRHLLRTVGCLSIVAGIMAAAPPAKAVVFKNYANENFCMGVTAGNMTSGTHIIMWQCNGAPDQDWAFQYTTAEGFYQINDTASDSGSYPIPECIALPDKDTQLGTYFIIWSCDYDTPDQFWYPFYVKNDANGHECVSFENYLAYQQGEGIRVPTPYLNEVADGWSVVLEQWQEGRWDDQVWCEY